MISLYYPTRLFDTEKRCFTADRHAFKRYAILSHRWDKKNELTFNQLLKHSSRPTSNDKFEKLCEVASRIYRCRFVWMDSVCINRNNATELEYSIRSMYWWYRHADICIVYLADAFDSTSLASSSWFTRGWTLQELLAPWHVAFYYGDWTRVSNLDFDIDPSYTQESNESANQGEGNSLGQCVADAAGVVKSFLYSTYEPSASNLEAVLTWSKHRHTSRPEDAVYSLVSLLDVCLPPRYGEGRDSALDRLRHACREACNSLTLKKDILDQPSFTDSGEPFILLCNPSKSKFCEHHQAIKGEPMIVHFLKDGSLDMSTHILFTSLPLPIYPTQLFFKATTNHVSESSSKEYLTFYRTPLRGHFFVSSSFEECKDCHFKAFCRDDSCSCRNRSFLANSPKTFATDPYLCKRDRKSPVLPLGRWARVRNAFIPLTRNNYLYIPESPSDSLHYPV